MAKEHLYVIEKIVEGVRGKQEGIYVNLFHVEKDRSNRWPEFLSDYHNADQIQVIQDAGVNGRVWITWTANRVTRPNGEKKTYYNINTIRPAMVSDKSASKDTPEPDEQPDVNQGNQEQKVIPFPQKKAASDAESATWTNADALYNSMKLTCAMLSADPRFKSLLKVSKTTEPLLVEMTLANAAKFKEFLEGKYNPTVASDDSDLKENPETPEEPNIPDVPADEDIPA